MTESTVSGFRIRLAVGTCLLLAFLTQTSYFGPQGPHRSATAKSRGVLQPAIAFSDVSDPAGPDFAELIRSDPLRFLKMAKRHYLDSVRDYRCTFVKQERIAGRLGEEQRIRVAFRERPFSVLMEWTENAGPARRVLFVRGRWQDDAGRMLAYVEPASPVARLFVRSVLRPIDGPQAKAVSRRTINQFGFGNVLDLITLYAERAVAQGTGSIEYAGEGNIDGRPTWILRRTLPYAGQGRWPDRVLIVHIDQEMLLPVACYAYADDDQQVLLGKYIFQDVQLNVGLTDADFDPKANGF